MEGRGVPADKAGFGASAPKILTAIVEHVLRKDAVIGEAITSYIDDLFSSTSVVSCESVRVHLRRWGLEAKETQLLDSANGVRVLGLHIDENLMWSRDLQYPRVPETSMTRRQIHGLLGR